MEWFTHFEICSKYNEWNEATQALKLPTLLEGEALASWLKLSEVEQQDYKLSQQKLIKKLTPPSFTILDEFHVRKLRPGKTRSIFTQDLKRLLQLAMPGLENEAKDKLLIHQFLAGLPADISWRLHVSGDLRQFPVVVERARLLMTVNNHNILQGSAAINTVNIQSEMSQIKTQIDNLTEQVAALRIRKPTVQRRPSPGVKQCFNCKGFGHLQRDCPSPRNRNFRPATQRCFNCGQVGHTQKECYHQGNEKGMPGAGLRHPN